MRFRRFESSVTSWQSARRSHNEHRRPVSTTRDRASLELAADRAAHVLLGMDVDVVATALLLDREKQRFRHPHAAALRNGRARRQRNDDRTSGALCTLVHVGGERSTDPGPLEAVAQQAARGHELVSECTLALRTALAYLLTA